MQSLNDAQIAECIRLFQDSVNQQNLENAVHYASLLSSNMISVKINVVSTVPVQTSNSFAVMDQRIARPPPGVQLQGAYPVPVQNNNTLPINCYNQAVVRSNSLYNINSQAGNINSSALTANNIAIGQTPIGLQQNPNYMPRGSIGLTLNNINLPSVTPPPSSSNPNR